MANPMTLNQYLRDAQRRGAAVDAELITLLDSVMSACKTIASGVSKGALAGILGGADSENVQGEAQKKLDVISNDVILAAGVASGAISAMASEEMDDIYLLPADAPKGKYLLLFDPLDGSSNIDVNISVGTIFSILRGPEGRMPTLQDFLQAGNKQICAGSVVYGPSTMLVLTIGQGAQGFTLDREVGEFVLTHPNIRVPVDTREFAINASNARFWEAPVKRYIDECVAGKTGARGADFNMRWVASMVAEVYRVMTRGGIFLYPRDTKDPSKPGRLRLMYEANPMSFIVEQAGGMSTTGRERIMDVQPTQLHQRIAVILGSKNEVERVVGYYKDAQ